MKSQIIYRPDKVGFFKKLCSCLYFFKPAEPNNYQLGIDSPKAQYVVKYIYKLQVNRKTLVLDLDETLVHSQFQPVTGHDFQINVNFLKQTFYQIVVQGVQFVVYVTIRPGAEQFIETMFEYYDIIMWTASLKEYADPVMDYIDPNRRAILRMYRDSCTPLKNGLTKNLNRLGKDLKDVIIIDNSVISFQLQPENAFHIKDFINDKSDRELDLMTPFLIWLSQQSDARPVDSNQRYYESNPQSISISKKASFVVNHQQLDDQYQQYEDQLNLNNKARFEKKIDKQEIISHSLNINKKDQHSPGFRTHTLQVGTNDYDDIELRDKVGLNSPHGEPAKDGQTDDEDDKVTIEYQ
ncbi:hypothetical protein pb186bvf_001707 [Paramecium bursaria]